MFNWDDVRFFLEVSRRGRLTAAAERLGVDHTTVARRISALEKDLDVRLFDRTPRGYTLTEAGSALMPHAEMIEAESLQLYRDISGSDAQAGGVVRVAATEALASQLIAPHLKDFYKRYPDITIELVISTLPIDLSRREADMAISLARPKSGRYVAWKLSDYALGLYAAPAYLARSGAITKEEDLQEQDYVWYIDDLLRVPELRILEKLVKDPHIVFHSSSVLTQFNATLAGVGLGLLHCFMAEQEPKLRRVLRKEVDVTRAYWLVVHEDLRRIARIDAVCQFLTSLLKDHHRLLMGQTR